MGNLCSEGGGADLAIGCVEAGGIQTSVTDQGDGTYLLRWWADTPRAWPVAIFVRIDGLHILGSPAEMNLIVAEVIPRDHSSPTNPSPGVQFQRRGSDAGGSPGMPGMGLRRRMTMSPEAMAGAAAGLSGRG